MTDDPERRHLFSCAARAVREAMEQLDRDSILREARAEILKRLRQGTETSQ